MNKEAFVSGFLKIAEEQPTAGLPPAPLALPKIPAAPTQRQVADKFTQIGADAKTRLSTAIPAIKEPLEVAQSMNQEIGDSARKARLSYFNPALAAITEAGNKYTNAGNFKLPEIGRFNLPAGVSELPGKEIYEGITRGKTYVNWWENLNNGVQEGVNKALPALGEINKAKEDFNANLNNFKKNWAYQHDDQLKNLAEAAGRIKKYEEVNPLRRMLGLTLARPIISSTPQFKAFQEVLTHPKINEVALYGMTHDPAMVKEVLKGALNPVSAGSITRTAGNALQYSANTASKLLPAEATGRVLPALSRALPQVARAGKAATNLGKGVTALGLLGNTALELPRIAQAGGVGEYVKDMLDRQRYAKAPLSYAYNVISNINSPIGTVLATGKSLADPETYQGVFEKLKETAKKQNFDRLPITI